MAAYVNKKGECFPCRWRGGSLARWREARLPASGRLPCQLAEEGRGDGIRVAACPHPRFLHAMGEGEIYLLFGYTQCRQSRNHFLLAIFYLNQKTLTVQITLAVE